MSNNQSPYTRQQRIALLSLAGFTQYASLKKSMARTLVRHGLISVLSRNSHGKAFYSITPKGMEVCR